VSETPDSAGVERIRLCERWSVSSAQSRYFWVLPETVGIVDAALKGARPDEIKVERWNKFDVVFSRSTMRALGIDVTADLIKESTFVD